MGSPFRRERFPRLATAKVAIVHDWLTGFGGAERCLEVFVGLFPDAPIFTSVYDADRFGATFPPERVRTSFLQRWPCAIDRYRDYLPFMPQAFASFDLRGYDLVLVSTHAFAKAINPAEGQVTVAYCYTPIRYLWGDLRAEYRATLPLAKRIGLDLLTPDLQRADLRAAHQMTRFVAISAEVQRRISAYYGRESIVVAPPVFTDQWTPVDRPTRDYYLIVSRFVPYKRVDLAVAACAELELPLKVVGTGPEEARVRAAALVNGVPAAGIEFCGFVPEESLRDLYANAKALLFTSHEDFGLAPLEANACGTPVLAYRGGGALETVREGVTGEFFENQTVESLVTALKTFDPSAYDPAAMRAHAETFARPSFVEQLCQILDETLAAGRSG